MSKNLTILVAAAALSSHLCAFAQDSSTTPSDTKKKTSASKKTEHVGKGTDVVNKNKPKDNTSDGKHGAVTTDSPATKTK